MPEHSRIALPQTLYGHLPDPLVEAFPHLVRLAETAGARIMDLYEKDIVVVLKEDESPVTPADEAAHRCLVDGLGRFVPDVPVISEEGSLPSPEERAAWSEYFLVDPLDGTKGFIARNGQFTVNIAFMAHHVPVAGIIHVPLQGVTYFGVHGGGAYRLDAAHGADGVAHPIHTCARVGASGPVVLQSNVDRTPRLDAFMGEAPHTRLRAGSSLKFCLLAEGQAQLFPCLHPTWEWDTAAGQAILEAAGGQVRGMEGEPFEYGKSTLLNGWFVASA